jgi:hypothetical protein
MDMALFPGIQGTILIAFAFAIGVLLYAHYSQFQREGAETRRQQRLADMSRSTLPLPENADQQSDLYNIVVINLIDDVVRSLPEIEGQ